MTRRTPLFKIERTPLFKIGRKPLFKIERNPLFKIERTPLFKTAVACLLSRGSGRHGKGKNPVNGYPFVLERMASSVQRPGNISHLHEKPWVHQ